MDFCEFNLIPGAGEQPPLAKIAVFSETGMNPKPQYNVQSAVNQYVGAHGYYDFIEEWLDNPWVRVVLFGLEYLEPSFGDFFGVRYFKADLVAGDPYLGAKLIILWEQTGSENPKPIIENALNHAIEGGTYNAFVLSTLDYPWIRVVITGINNLPFIPYDGRGANVL